ncbi:MAG: hypothetical protein ACYC7D_04065 [Nitrososphaerales archaeon]
MVDKYPEVIEFTGVGRASLKQIHLIALSLVILGLIFAYYAPQGFILLIIFIVIAAGYDMVFIRKSQKPVKISLYLRTNPVEASYGEKKIGEITTGTIQTDMENPNELGYRPTPKKDLMVWKFDSPEDARIVAKRLLEYLQRDA